MFRTCHTSHPRDAAIVITNTFWLEAILRVQCLSLVTQGFPTHGMVKGYKYVGDVEKRLVKSMHREGIPFTKILRIAHRSLETVTKVLYPAKNGRKKQVKKGAPKKLPPKVFGKVLRSMRILQLQKHPKGKEVTKEMVLAHAGLEASARTLEREFRDRHIHFYRLKQRPLLTRDDMQQRKAWVLRHRSRSRQGWVKKPHAIIDNKRYPIYGTEAGRRHAARRSIRGAYQEKGQMPGQHMVQPKGGNIRFPAAGVMVSAAVSDGKIRMWQYIEGPWNGESAAASTNGRSQGP